MNDFAQLQARFQQAVLDGSVDVLDDLLDGRAETRDVLLGVYQNAYTSRLVDVMRNNHETLHAYLGDEAFDDMARAYIAAHPSGHANLRWFSAKLPAFLTATEPYDEHPVLADLADLENALNDAFDAADEPVLPIGDLASIPPEQWSELTFTPHASCRRLDFQTNASAIWSAIAGEETPPDVAAGETEDAILVWRHETTAMMRPLDEEETMMWDEAAQGVPFGVLCTMLATRVDPDSAAARAAGYLAQWINAGMLTRADVRPARSKAAKNLAAAR